MISFCLPWECVSNLMFHLTLYVRPRSIYIFGKRGERGLGLGVRPSTKRNTQLVNKVDCKV